MHCDFPKEAELSGFALERLSAALDALSASIRNGLRIPSACTQRTLLSEGYWTETRVVSGQNGRSCEEVCVAIVRNGSSSAKIEWSPTDDDIFTSIGVGIALFIRSDLSSEMLWHDWCYVTGNDGPFILEFCWTAFQCTQPRPFIRNFHVEVSGDWYMAHPETIR
jgi:hypothetical protein